MNHSINFISRHARSNYMSSCIQNLPRNLKETFAITIGNLYRRKQTIKMLLWFIIVACHLIIVFPVLSQQSPWSNNVMFNPVPSAERSTIVNDQRTSATWIFDDALITHWHEGKRKNSRNLLDKFLSSSQFAPEFWSSK